MQEYNFYYDIVSLFFVGAMNKLLVSLFFSFASSYIMAMKLTGQERLPSLIDATKAGNKEAVKKILARANQDNSFCAEVSTALQELSRCSNDDAIKVLFDCDVSPAFKDTAGGGIYPFTPLVLAAWLGWSRTVEALLQYSAMTEEVGANGDTALIKAVEQGHPRVLEVLLKHGADAKAKDWLKRSALEVCLCGLKNLEEHQDNLSHFLNVEQKRQEYLKCQKLLGDALGRIQ